jgi:hypothetical protein
MTAEELEQHYDDLTLDWYKANRDSSICDAREALRATKEPTA